MTRVTVIAATGTLGRALLNRLQAEAIGVIAVGRDREKLAALPPGIETRLANLTDPAALAAALSDAELLVSCANARFVPEILAALPPAGIERLVLMGSTRRFSKVPDATATAVRAAESALAACPIPTVFLLATLIYGGDAGVVEILARQIRRFSLLPLVGGRALVQPIHIDDVAAALVAAVLRPNAPGTPIVIAGPRPMSYRDMVRTIAVARHLRLILLPIPSVVVGAA
ncbi:MAG: NAD(P)H-binding protein, partial [Aliidongia sp.]